MEILNLLDISTGLVAVTKIDIAEPDWVEMVVDDVKKLVKGTFLDGAPIVPVSPVKNIGIDRLNEEIAHIAKQVKARRDKGIFRLPIDRVFTIKGFGTVIAGTILSGRIAAGDTVELLPKGVQLRVRGVQVHDKSVDTGDIGFRTAINLGRVEKESIERGNVLAEPGFYKPTHMIDAQFTLLKSWGRELENRARVRVHVGTSEVIARIYLLDKEKFSPGDGGFVQLHFEKPVAADRGDRYVVRSYSPLYTMGGGVILDVHPAKHRRFQQEVIKKLERLYKGDPNQVVIETFDSARFTPRTENELAKAIGITMDELAKRLEELKKSNRVIKAGKNRLMSSENYAMLQRKIVVLLETFHKENPLLLSIPAGKLRVLIKQTVDQSLYDEILGILKNEGVIEKDGDQVSLAGRTVELSPKMKENKKRIKKQFLDNLFDPPRFEDIVDDMGDGVRKLLAYMVDSGELVQVEKDVYFHKNALEEGKMKVVSLLSGGTEEASIADMRKAFEGASRKNLVALLEYFDRIKFTVRDGTVRKLKR
jgi:selenocysteine-specific elongation factor